MWGIFDQLSYCQFFKKTLLHGVNSLSYVASSGDMIADDEFEKYAVVTS
jgi:hypothetical protein